jgi:iron complex transport system ATP-binding protein
MVVVADGQVIATGSPEQVVTSELLASVFGLRAEVITVDGAPAVVPTRSR